MGGKATLYRGGPDPGATPSVDRRIRSATLRQVSRGCAVGLYTPLPVSLDGQRERTRPLDPRGVGVILEVWGNPFPPSCSPTV